MYIHIYMDRQRKRERVYAVRLADNTYHHEPRP